MSLLFEKKKRAPAYANERRLEEEQDRLILLLLSCSCLLHFNSNTVNSLHCFVAVGPATAAAADTVARDCFFTSPSSLHHNLLHVHVLLVKGKQTGRFDLVVGRRWPVSWRCWTICRGRWTVGR